MLNISICNKYALISPKTNIFNTIIRPEASVLCCRPLHMLQFSHAQILKPIIYVPVASCKAINYLFIGQL